MIGPSVGGFPADGDDEVPVLIDFEFSSTVKTVDVVPARPSSTLNVICRACVASE